jgi:predicted RNA-binding Zn ribbon-like protein
MTARGSGTGGADKERSFLILGNLPCLDLVNTEAMSEGEPVDMLAGFPDLVAWLGEAGVLAEGAARTARERWEGRSEATAAFRQALVLRASLRQMVGRLAEGKGATQEQVESINRVLAERSAYRQLIRKGKGYTSTLVSERESAMHLLVPVAESAAWLLEQGDLALLRRCEDPRCILYFYDTTRNGRRRWCSMAGCGSRAKAAAYYRRKRGAPKHH